MARTLQRDGDPYPVLLGTDLRLEIGGLVRRMWPRRRVALVTQRRVRTLHGAAVESSLRAAGIPFESFTMPEGEARKTLRTVERLYGALLRNRFTRDDAIIAFGGGTVGDTAGFVAATFLRGLPYAQLPTTLLAQIDSAIGAKVGVNHSLGKNLIGAIYRPDAVWIDPGFLSTLPRRELDSGLFELAKYGFIGAPRVLERLSRGGASMSPTDPALVACIADAVRRKLDVVREDEREQGLRRVLNFGHTIGHGLESAGDYGRLRHGEAVGWGMLGAIRLAERRGRVDKTTAARLEAAVRSVGRLPEVSKLSRRRVLAAVSRDKKIGHGGLRMVLPVGWGEVEIVEGVPLEDVAWAVSSLGVRGR